MAHFVISALSAVAYGGYTYFRNLLPALAESDRANRYTILVKPQHLEDLAVRNANLRFLPVRICGVSSGGRMIWEQAVLPRLVKRWKADAVYTANNVGLLRCDVPTVIAIRNLEPFFHRRFEDGRSSRVRNDLLMMLTELSIERAERVVVVSDYAREVVAKRYGASEKLRVIHHGRPEVAPDVEAALRLRKSCGLEEDYYLTNSKFVPYGNLENLVEGYARANERNPRLPKLALAGGDASPSCKAKVLEAIRESRLQDKIVLLGLIPNATNLGLMRAARLFLFPSVLEACPNTLIEAMSMGCVIASSHCPPMPEIAGESVIYYDPVSPDDIAAKILMAEGLTGESAGRLRSAALERSRRFDWTDNARQLVSVLEEAAGDA